MAELRALPSFLLTAIRSDPVAVRPLWAPSSRMLGVVVVALVAGAGLAALYDFRSDLGQVPRGLYALQLALRLALAGALGWLALREASPAEVATRSLSVPTLVIGLLLLGFLPLWFALEVDADLGLDPHHWLCYRLIVGFALPTAAILAWLVARAYPLRPVLNGALAGAASGLFAEAALFLVCPFSELGHAILVHASAILTLTLGGAVAGAISRRRFRRA